MAKNRNRTRAARCGRAQNPYRICHSSGAISEISAGQFYLHLRLGNLVSSLSGGDTRTARVKPGLVCWVNESDGGLEFIPAGPPDPPQPAIQSNWIAVERALLLARGIPIGYEGAWPIAA